MLLLSLSSCLVLGHGFPCWEEKSVLPQGVSLSQKSRQDTLGLAPFCAAFLRCQRLGHRACKPKRHKFHNLQFSFSAVNSSALALILEPLYTGH